MVAGGERRFRNPAKQIFMLGFSGRSVAKMNLFEEISEHGIFHGIPIYNDNKPLNIKDKKCLFIIEWE